MVKIELRNYLFENEVNSAEILQIKSDVSRSLELEKGLGGYLGISSEIREKMIGDIAESTHLVCKFLQIPVPHFGLIFPWDGKPGKTYFNNKNILANARISNEFPKGLVKYSPTYLKSVADFMTGKPSPFSNALSGVTAHECYHLWQMRKFPKVLQREGMMLDSLGEDKTWVTQRSEHAARAFEHAYNGSNAGSYYREHPDKIPSVISSLLKFQTEQSI